LYNNKMVLRYGGLVTSCIVIDSMQSNTPRNHCPQNDAKMNTIQGKASSTRASLAIAQEQFCLVSITAAAPTLSVTQPYRAEALDAATRDVRMKSREMTSLTHPFP
jgi:hypothetical protein